MTSLITSPADCSRHSSSSSSSSNV